MNINPVDAVSHDVEKNAEQPEQDDGAWMTPELRERIARETAEIDRRRAAGLPDGCTPWEVIRERTRRVLVAAGVPGADLL